MEIRHLKYFLGVAEELHFGRAAEKMHISQPPLSRQILDLEDELGVKLFDRTTRGVRMTPAGEYLKKEAEQLLKRAERIKADVARAADESGHRVRLGFVGSAIYSFLPELMGRIARRRPEAAFEFFELSSDEQARALDSGRIDLGFVRSWIHEGGVRFAPLSEETLSVVFSDSLYSADQGEFSLASLAGLPSIAFSDACAPTLQSIIDSVCARAGFSPRRAFVANQYDAVLRFVASGFGWAIVPTLAYENSRLEMRSIELSDLPERIVIGLAWREDESDSYILGLIEDVKRYFADRGSGGP
jgi:Transcriptional regulator